MVIYIGVIVGAIACVSRAGSVEAITASLPAGGHWTSFVGGIPLAVVAGWFIIMFMNAMPHTAVTQVTVSAKSGKAAKYGLILAGMLMVPVGVISAFWGIIGLSMFPGLESGAMALPKVAMTLSPFIAGIALAGLWAADVSTATGFLMGGSLMITKDIVVKHFKKDMSEKNQLLLARCMVVVIAALGFVSALHVKGILDVMMKFLTLFTPFTILLLIIYLCPRFARRSTAWWVFIPGFATFALTTFIAPSLALYGQPVYSTFIVSIIGVVLSNVIDSRKADAGALYCELPEN